MKGTSETQSAERSLAKTLRKARAAGRLTAEHDAEFIAMDGDATQLAEIAPLMQDVRAFGGLPKRVDGTSDAQCAERNLAKRFKKARDAGRFSACDGSSTFGLKSTQQE